LPRHHPGLFRRLASGWEGGILNASGEWRPPFVNVPLTFSRFFLLLMDLRRNRLDGRLTRLPPAPTLDKYEEKCRSGRHRRARAAAVPAARVVNSLVQKYI
jgi:hypothetical protein